MNLARSVSVSLFFLAGVLASPSAQAQTPVAVNSAFATLTPIVPKQITETPSSVVPVRYFDNLNPIRAKIKRTGTADSFPWQKFTQIQRHATMAYMTRNISGMKWHVVMRQIDRRPDLYNIIPVKSGVPDLSKARANKINVIPCAAPFGCFVSFADAFASMAATLDNDPVYNKFRTYGEIAAKWSSTDEVSGIFNFAQHVGATGMTPQTPVDRNDVGKMASMLIGMTFPEYGGFEDFDLLEPSAGTKIESMKDLLTVEVMRDGLAKYYDTGNPTPTRADAWYALNKANTAFVSRPMPSVAQGTQPPTPPTLPPPAALPAR